MSAKSRRCSRSLDRPFEPATLRRAREIADAYQIILGREDNEYYGRALELPNIMGNGKTPDECVEATRDVLVTAVAYMLEQGQSPPPAAAEHQRTEQINIRLTPEEKLRLEQAARNKGFRTVSDYVRNAGLAEGH